MIPRSCAAATRPARRWPICSGSRRCPRGRPLGTCWRGTDLEIGRREVPMPAEPQRRDLWDNPMGTDGFEFVDFTPLIADPAPPGVGLTAIDHLTHNVHRGRMELWAEFYERLFNFREIRYFDIEGKLTGLRSKAMTSPCGRIRIPINESADDKSQIAEYLEAYHGEGIQHIALATADIYATVEGLQSCGVSFMSVPDTYYEAVDSRVLGHGEDLARLQRDRILIDGAPGDGQGLLLQIFTETVIGPIFFEIIERKGNEGL